MTKEELESLEDDEEFAEWQASLREAIRRLQEQEMEDDER